jgi:hypothetical protein
MTRVLLALLVLLLLGSPARAATLSGATLPDTYPVDGQTLVLNGLGLRTFTVLGIRGYVAALYVAQRSHDAQAILASPTPKVLLLQFLRSVTKEQIARQFHAGEVVNCGQGGCDAEDQADFDRVVAAAPAVSPGDTYTFVITRGGVRFYADNRLLAQSTKPDLGRLFLSGFISDHPPSPQLRAQLLGG